MVKISLGGVDKTQFCKPKSLKIDMDSSHYKTCSVTLYNMKITDGVPEEGEIIRVDLIKNDGTPIMLFEGHIDSKPSIKQMSPNSDKLEVQISSNGYRFIPYRRTVTETFDIPDGAEYITAKQISMRRRWIWELIQNASDCAFQSKGVNISVMHDTSSRQLHFIHDGKPFKYGNLIDLITQISSKQSDTEEKTGKFGTGFIATHLLSETVKLNSILQDDNGNRKMFECIIDRSGTDYQDIRENIKKNLNNIEGIRNGSSDIVHCPTEHKTTFTYFIESEDANQAVSIGLKDLENAAPFVLALNHTISSINCNGIEFNVKSSRTVLNGAFRKIEVESFWEDFTLLCKTENEVTILFSVKEITPFQYKALPYPENFPKLFCNFPLIGTESFSSPIVVNCANFEVEKDRNAIHEGNQENIRVLETARIMYNSLLDLAAQNQWEGIYNICFCKPNKSSQLQQNLYNSFAIKAETLPIVTVNCDGELYGKASFCIERDGKLEYQIWIPKTDKADVNDEFWGIVNAFSKFFIPSLATYKEWGKIFNNKITVQNINEWFFKDMTFTEICNNCHSDCYVWLNSYYSFWMKISNLESFCKEALVLNQNQKFVSVNTLVTDNDIDEELKNILLNLGEDIRELLIAKEIAIPIEANVTSKDNKYIAKRIQEKINKLLSEETVNNVKREPKTQLTFNKLTNWFLVNPDRGSEFFDTLYNKRNMLSTVEENIRRFRIAEKVESKNITDSELDLLLDNHRKISELLANCDDLSAEEMKVELQHLSLHNDNGLEFYKNILERTIENVHQYLMETGLYNVADTVNEWKESQYSSTVFPAKKDDKDIRIIVRPSDYDKIIFYHDQELAALDDTDYELWTDNERNDTRMITLGDILKTTGITMIPLRKFYNK